MTMKQWMKSWAVAVVAVAAPAMLGLSSCKKETKADVPAAQAVAGTYKGTLDVTMAGNPIDGITGNSATITVTQTGSTVTLQLTESTLLTQFFGSQPIGATDVTVTQSGDTFTLSGAGQADMNGLKLDMTVAGTGKTSAMQFTITVPTVGVVATFNGSRQ